MLPSKITADQLSTQLTTTEREIVLAATEPRVKDLSVPVVAGKMTEVIGRAILTLATKPMTKDERLKLEELIVHDLYVSFPNITLREVEIAVHKGSMGEFAKKPDEVVFFSVKSIHDWIKHYKTVLKREAIAKQREFEDKLNQKPVPTLEEQQIANLSLLNKCLIIPYNELRETGNYIMNPMMANRIYIMLDSMGIIPFTPDRKRNEIWPKAKEKYLAGLSKYKNLSEAMEAKRLIKEVLEQSEETEALIKIEARCLGLEILLKEMAETEIDLQEIINEKLTK